MFAGTFNPAGWAHCDGALLPISENETLFNLIGTTYGGDGQETFALPNLCGRLPIHQGQGPGIWQNYQLGESAGVESVTLTTQQIPAHSHQPLATNAPTSNDPAGRAWASSPARQFVTGVTPDVDMVPAIGVNGGSQPHENMQPFLVVTFIISLFGIFPSQT
jgi:microcystin-dependent protein